MDIQVKDISKIYGVGESRVTALHHANMQIRPGDFISIMGPSGSGKSTLLHIISGLDTPTSGQVLYGDTDIHHGSDRELSAFRRRKIGFIFQHFNLLPVLTAQENITMPLLLDGRQPDEAYLQEIAAFLGIDKRLTHLPHELSGGQQQRVAIARALATDPEIIYFDEPTSALDPELTGEVLSVMRQLAEEGMTMLVVTHEMGFARNVSSKTVFMENGVVVEQAPSQEFFANPKEERTREFLQKISQHA